MQWTCGRGMRVELQKRVGPNRPKILEEVVPSPSTKAEMTGRAKTIEAHLLVSCSTLVNNENTCSSHISQKFQVKIA